MDIGLFILITIFIIGCVVPLYFYFKNNKEWLTQEMNKPRYRLKLTVSAVNIEYFTGEYINPDIIDGKRFTSFDLATNELLNIKNKGYVDNHSLTYYPHDRVIKIEFEEELREICK